MIYVLADIHGNEQRFYSVMKQINLQPEDTLYVLGDVIDRHPGGIRILRKIMSMPNAKMILGNHEYMMLRALGFPYDDNWDDGGALGHWYRNGGKVPYVHWKHIRKTIRQEIVDYLHTLPLEIDLEVNGTTYKLVHAAPAEEYDFDAKYKNAPYFAVWKRLKIDYPLSGKYTLIFGHTTTKHFQDRIPMEIWIGNDRIGIDCGSGYPEDSSEGRLACLRLDDGKIFYSEEGKYV